MQYLFNSANESIHVFKVTTVVCDMRANTNYFEKSIDSEFRLVQCVLQTI